MMQKRYWILISVFFISVIPNLSFAVGGIVLDSATVQLPKVLADQRQDLVMNLLRQQAMMRFASLKLPDNMVDWNREKGLLRQRIIGKTKTKIDHTLPLNIIQTDSIILDGYVVKNISFQTQPGISTTANLFKPNGNGPFPAVIAMCGHSTNGRMGDRYQSLGHTLALNGYVCLLVDPWGSGERTTIQGQYEYHGGYLGSSLMDIGETFMGMLLTDNIRGVDLLISLPYVDSTRIGATGSSGGGNQTMWLSAIDERIKAAVPVVSVGTFESCVMRSNCVCELLIDGLTFAETSFVLSLIAPRALKMCNHKQDGIPFLPSEMKRSYANAKGIFELYGCPENIAYEIFDLKHGYYPEDREAMLGWFDLHLKGVGTGKPKKEMPFDLLPVEKVMTYTGKRPKEIISTAEFCRTRGDELRQRILARKGIDVSSAQEELKQILRMQEGVPVKVNRGSTAENWDQITLETNQRKVIPLLHRSPTKKKKGYVVMVSSEGRDSIPYSEIEEAIKAGYGILLPDLSSTGELSTNNYVHYYKLHDVARANLWLGKSTLGEWVGELDVVVGFLKDNFVSDNIEIRAYKEAGVAALFASVLDNGAIKRITVIDSPISYLFDERDKLGYYSMGIHLPGILEWGDISLATALTGSAVSFIRPRTMSGRLLNAETLALFEQEYASLMKQTGNRSQVTFD